MRKSPFEYGTRKDLESKEGKLTPQFPEGEKGNPSDFRGERRKRGVHSMRLLRDVGKRKGVGMLREGRKKRGKEG